MTDARAADGRPRVASTCTPTTPAPASPTRSGSRSRSAARPPTWPSPRRGSGTAAAVLTKVGDDPFGDYVVAKLASFGVDTSFVGRHPTLRTPLAFAALTPPEDPELLFYREPAAPDMQLDAGDVDARRVARRRRAVGRRVGDGRGAGPHDGHAASLDDRHRRPPHGARPRLPRRAVGRASDEARR